MNQKKIILFFCTLLLIFTFPAFPVRAEESREDEDVTMAPYFLVVSEDTSVDCFPLKETDVTANINGSIAEIFVTQTYQNEGDSPIDANYLFPASTKVSVHGMTMQVGNDIVTAQIREKEEAKQEFEEAKSEGKSASLLEQKRSNVFHMDVANIMPGDTVTIQLHYTELISPEEGMYQFVFPTVVGPRYLEPSEGPGQDEEWAITPYLENGTDVTGEYHMAVNLSTGVPIANLSSKSHDISIAWHNHSSAAITLADPSDYAGDRDFILDYKLTGSQIESGLVLSEGEAENFFMLTIQPPERYTPEEIPPREYIFVLDVSGSMNGYPMDTAKALIRDLVSNLKETDAFNLVLFSGSSEQLSPESLAATKENIGKAIDLIDKQEGSGGTSLSPALEKAIRIPSGQDKARSIIIITDGYISNEENVFDLIGRNLGTASFFSFGIGSSVNRCLIEGIADAGAGESFVVTDAEDAAETAERFRTYIQAPVLTDIKVSYDGFDVYDVEPAVFPTLFAQKPIVLFGKYKGGAEGTVTVTGKTGNKDYSQEIAVSAIQPVTGDDAIRYLWARTRVERLMDYGYNKDNPEVRDEVTQLGLAYSMMTPYTSFVAVIDTIRNPEGKSADVDQPLPLPHGVSALAVGGGYQAYSEPSMVLPTLSLLCILFAGALCRRRKRREGSI